MTKLCVFKEEKINDLVDDTVTQWLAAQLGASDHPVRSLNGVSVSAQVLFSPIQKHVSEVNCKLYIVCRSAGKLLFVCV